MSMLTELKRRKVLKVGATYLVVAWLAIQAVSIAFPAFDAPPWALRVFILLAMIGFPVVMLLTWVIDLTPEGVKLDPDVSSSKGVVAVAVLLIALALGWYYYGQPSFRKGDVAPVATTPAPVATTAAAPQKSIAVLAFTDLSPQHDQDYFSDGIAEELLNALAKVQDLKVAGRTSSFYYKGRNEDLRTIGKALGVANVLEGSVRTQGDKVRITAQLIRSEDGFHLWSESYDGDLKDVFALQERIARAITDKLQAVLNGRQQQRLVPVATQNPEAYALYLQATAVFNRREARKFTDTIAVLEQALALDPKFVRAHARLASVQAIRSVYIPTDPAKASGEVEKHARAATALDPSLAEPYAALGYSRWLRRQRLASFEAFGQALALDPDDVTANYWFAVALLQAGYTKRGTKLLDHVLAIDPMYPLAVQWRGFQYFDAGDLEAARRCYRRAADLGLSVAAHGLAQIADEEGHEAEAISQMAIVLRVYDYDLPNGVEELLAAGIYGNPTAREQALRWIDTYLAAPHGRVLSAVPFTLLQLGSPARALDLLQRSITTNDAISFIEIWSPRGEGARRTTEFAKFVRTIGFVSLWDKYGPPDLCRKNDQGEYVCE